MNVVRVLKYRQCTINVTLRCLRITILFVLKQELLHTLILGENILKIKYMLLSAVKLHEKYSIISRITEILSWVSLVKNLIEIEIVGGISKKTLISNFMKIVSVGSESFHVEG